MRKSDICLVKYIYWEATNKHLDCKDCPCTCEHSSKHPDELLPTKPPEKGRGEKK